MIYKYYTNNQDIILLNASDNYNHAYIIKEDGSVKEETFTEEIDKIVIGNDTFIKNGDDLLFNNVSYIYIS